MRSSCEKRASGSEDCRIRESGSAKAGESKSRTGKPEQRRSASESERTEPSVLFFAAFCTALGKGAESESGERKREERTRGRKCDGRKRGKNYRSEKHRAIWKQNADSLKYF